MMNISFLPKYYSSLTNNNIDNKANSSDVKSNAECNNNKNLNNIVPSSLLNAYLSNNLKISFTGCCNSDNGRCFLRKTFLHLKSELPEYDKKSLKGDIIKFKYCIFGDTSKSADNKVKDSEDIIDFKDYIFDSIERICFSYCKFIEKVDFTNAKFNVEDTERGQINFSYNTFYNQAVFKNAVFSTKPNFEDTLFNAGADFSGVDPDMMKEMLSGAAYLKGTKDKIILPKNVTLEDTGIIEWEQNVGEQIIDDFDSPKLPINWGKNLTNVKYSDIGGLDSIIKDIRQIVELPIKRPDFCKEIGMDRRNILLCGPPGCGKTTIAKAIAHESGANFFPINGPELESKYAGETEERLRKVFETAKENQPAIIFFDEIDAIGSSRISSDESGSQFTNKVLDQLLTLLDGFNTETHNITVIAATNRPDLLDEAIKRSGRFDYKIEIPLPDEKGCKQILEIATRNKKLEDGIDMEDLAKKCHKAGLSGADISHIANDALNRCIVSNPSLIRELLDNPEFKPNPEDIIIKSKHLNDAINAFIEANKKSTNQNECNYLYV